jgi:hypothetical protein
MVKRELDVFLSSNQEEFEKIRKVVSKVICSIPYLTCEPLKKEARKR